MPVNEDGPARCRVGQKRSSDERERCASGVRGEGVLRLEREAVDRRLDQGHS